MGLEVETESAAERFARVKQAEPGETLFTSAALRMFAALRGVWARIEDPDGQTLAEYGIIITTIAVAVTILSVLVFREALVSSFSAATSCLKGSC